MDDRYAYMLNALWTRHFDLGRVVRFRHVQHGRHAVTYEVLTAQQRQYGVYLFPPAFEESALNQMAEAILKLDANRFSVAPLQKSMDDTWTVGGPQGTHMMVGLNTDGQTQPPETWSTHDMSQLGLRLGWMHRLLLEQIPLTPTEPSGYAAGLRASLSVAPNLSQRTPKLNPAHLERLSNNLADIPPTGWCHGDIHPAAFLLDHDRQIRTVVDWALLHPGDPLEDLIDAFTHWCIAADGTVTTETARALLESYRSLRPIAREDWLPAVRTWCARRIINAIADRSPLPVSFAHILADPAALAQAISLCEAK